MSQTKESLNGAGGARDNSGRKKKDGRKVTFFLSTHAQNLLKATAQKAGNNNMTAEVERAIRVHAAREGVEVTEEEAAT